jgi:shikimate dehydrogenase
VTYSLAQAGWQVVLTARRTSQAQDLVDAVAPYVGRDQLGVQALSRDAMEYQVETPHLLVNTTPLGMHPNGDSCPWPVGLRLPENAFVYDLVYNPAETVLVRMALRAGLSAHTGLGMLVEQAALSLERWTNRSVPREAMWKAVQPLQPSPLQDQPR